MLGDATFIQLVRDQRAKLMSLITTRVDREARSLGIEVVDVKISRADLPEANSQAIYQRMQTERQQEATQIRALGEQQARRIRAEADREAVVIVAEAQKESEQTRGKGEADRNRLLAAAFNVDPEFFAFYRSMQAYELGLGGTDTRWVISPDSEFFRFFNDSDALAAPPRPAGTAGRGPAPATEAAPDVAPPDAAMTPPPEAPEPAATPAPTAPAAASDSAATAPTADAPEAATGEPITIE